MPNFSDVCGLRLYLSTIWKCVLQISDELRKPCALESFDVEYIVYENLFNWIDYSDLQLPRTRQANLLLLDEKLDIWVRSNTIYCIEHWVG